MHNELLGMKLTPAPHHELVHNNLGADLFVLLIDVNISTFLFELMCQVTSKDVFVANLKGLHEHILKVVPFIF